MTSEQDRPLILIADDTPENLDVLRGILKDEYRIKVAISGRRCLEIATGPELPGLILLDVMMPEMDGFEVCRRLKVDPATRLIPVIFVTGLDTVKDEEAGFAAGGVDYISKPFSPSTVLARVRAHMTLFNQARALARLLREQMNRTVPEESRSPSMADSSSLLAQVLEQFGDFAMRAESEEIAQIVEELQRVQHSAVEARPWLERLAAAVKLYRPATAPRSLQQAGAVEFIAQAQGGHLDLQQLSKQIGTIMGKLQEGNTHCQDELRDLVKVLAGTSHVHHAEKVLFAARNYHYLEAKNLLARLAQTLGIHIES